MPLKSKPKRTGRKPLWKPYFLVDIYRGIRNGLPLSEVAKSIGTTKRTLVKWQKDNPDIRRAVDTARRELSEGESFPKWIYERLSPDLRQLWDWICEWEDEPNGIARIEMLLEDQGKRVRQQLFLYALCACRFSASAAMTKVNVTKDEFDKWVNEDPDFEKLVREIDWHKGNFFESSLVKLVEEGNPGAILFANRTWNRSRGYAPKSEVDVNVSGQVMHGVVDLAELIPQLSEGARMELLEAIRKRDQKQNPRLTVTPTEVMNGRILQTLEAVDEK